ncbi:SDR family NAD(P)-dependent oxidoreductase [Nocardia sp. NPDC058058]|uniref:SDR family NAD(P)-dependent oxidoreductase n=1 Tax=Nocardia sp. NPDC058058 TaxID=3346317 RepID=UPI0036DF5491
MPKTVVISGGTDGMGRAFALARLSRGDRVIAIGSNPAKGESLIAAAAATARNLTFLRADLSSTVEVNRVIDQVTVTTPTVDALLLFANRVLPQRVLTPEGFEHTFALYYLSRHLLSHGLTPLLDRSPTPTIISIAGVGVTKGSINWTDPQLSRRYTPITAQLQAGRANDLLAVYYAETSHSPIPFILYHPGFTRSGDHSPLNPPTRLLLRTLSRLAAQPITTAIAPLHDFVDTPPAAPLTAIDRGRPVPLDFPTLNPVTARRLADLTATMLAAQQPNSL